MQCTLSAGVAPQLVYVGHQVTVTCNFTLEKQLGYSCNVFGVFWKFQNIMEPYFNDIASSEAIYMERTCMSNSKFSYVI